MQERDRLRVQLTMISMNYNRLASNMDDGSPLVSMNDKIRMIDKKIWLCGCHYAN